MDPINSGDAIFVNFFVQANGIKLGPQHQTGGVGQRSPVSDGNKPQGGAGCC